MKAIIDNKLTIPLSPQNIQEIDFSELDSFSIHYSFENNNLIIFPQKINLTEINMNSLYNNWFMYNCSIEYAGLGGTGCEFSILIKQKDF